MFGGEPAELFESSLDLLAPILIRQQIILAHYLPGNAEGPEENRGRGARAVHTVRAVEDERTTVGVEQFAEESRVLVARIIDEQRVHLSVELWRER